MSVTCQLESTDIGQTIRVALGPGRSTLVHLKKGISPKQKKNQQKNNHINNNM